MENEEQVEMKNSVESENIIDLKDPVESENIIDLKCSIDNDGIVSCNVSKEKFKEIQNKNIKPKKIIFEID